MKNDVQDNSNTVDGKNDEKTDPVKQSTSGRIGCIIVLLIGICYVALSFLCVTPPKYPKYEIILEEFPWLKTLFYIIK
jgi:uncharacterized membrane protein YkgB